MKAPQADGAALRRVNYPGQSRFASWYFGICALVCVLWRCASRQCVAVGIRVYGVRGELWY